MKKPEAAAKPVPNPSGILVQAFRYLRLAALVALWLSAPGVHASPFDFPPSNFDIMDTKGAQVIGHAHYEVAADSDGYATAFGENRFNNGEYDIERGKLEMPENDRLPRMVTFEHTFFDANGAVLRANKASFQTGLASCLQYKDGRPVTRSRVLKFPPDTFAGAAIVIPLKDYLQAGNQSGVVLHDFNCIPDPEVIEVKAYPRSPSEWAHFPGTVVRVDVKPDFGLLDFFIAMLVPQIRVWFSPSENWRFVGGQFSRFYKGPEVLLVLASKTGQKQTGTNR